MPQGDRVRVSRRRLLQAGAGGVAAAGLGIGAPWLRGAESPASPTPVPAGSPLRMIWKLERPKPALPNSCLWTWDHSTNWMLDDPGMLNFGCHNRYLKRGVCGHTAPGWKA